MPLQPSNSSIFSLLLTVTCVAVCLSLVAGIPVKESPSQTVLTLNNCKDLHVLIELICKNIPLIYSQAYFNTESSGRRNKRFDSGKNWSPSQSSQLHECCYKQCTLDDILGYCA